MNSTHHPILIIEDSPEEFEMVRIAFEEANLMNPIYHCDDGDEALDFLYRRGDYADPSKAPRPSIILLDLNLPGIDGREVLEEIKRDPSLKLIPVIVLTNSNDERDIERCYRDGANSYICKPVNFQGFIESINKLKEYWLTISVIPKT